MRFNAINCYNSTNELLSIINFIKQNYEDEDYHVDSFPKDFGYGAFDQDGLELEPNASSNSETKPRILLMGLRRSGKSSIQKVVFHKMSPNETLFLESTSKIVKDDINNSSFVQFQIWDLIGHFNILTVFAHHDLLAGNGICYVTKWIDNFFHSVCDQAGHALGQLTY